MLGIKRKKKLMVLVLCAVIVTLACWKRPVALPFKDGIIKIELYSNGRKIEVKTDNEIDALVNSFKNIKAVRELQWPAAGVPYGIIIYYEDNSCDVYNVCSPSLVTGNLDLGAVGKALFKIKYKSGEEGFKNLYDLVRGYFG